MQNLNPPIAPAAAPAARTTPVTLAGLILIACVASGNLAAAEPAPENAEVKPNVLFIAVDDLNDWITPLGGHPQGSTPHIDRLAQSGVLFSNAHCAAPACNPSRAALMTGIPPHLSGVYLNSQPWRPALPDAVTIPQRFSQHGYRSAGSGKIYHGAFPDPASWDAYFPSKEKPQFSDPRPPGTPLNGLNKGHFDWAPVPATDDEMGDAKTASWIAAELGRSHDQPFFLACGIYRPHLPWFVPKKYFDRFPLESVALPRVLESDLNDVPPAGVRMAKPNGDHAAVTRAGQWQRAVQGYLASIAFADAMVGRVLDALEAGPNRDRTIVVFWTDHGWHLGEKKHWRKFALWERATRTPVIVRVPRGAPGLPDGTVAGGTCDAPVSLMDLYPTLIELCGLGKADGVHGKSLVPLLANPDAPVNEPILITHGRHNHAVRDRHFRLIRYADGSEELYDHRSDPHEWNNLASDDRYRAEKARLAAALPGINVPDAPKRTR